MYTFLDEFDAIAKARDDQHELGELKRVINSLLQNIDAMKQEAVMIAATNHAELLDNAIWRRFLQVVEVGVPGQKEIMDMIDIFQNHLVLKCLTTCQRNWLFLLWLMESHLQI